MSFNHVVIIGVGLIGGSFALAARRAGLVGRVTGWNAGASLEAALARDVIDAVEKSFDAGRVCDADLVYLAAPVGGIIEFLRTRGSQFKPGTLITDAGSAKRDICRAARESLPTGVRFVGGHPMAGSHQTGVEHASPDLFQNAPYALMVAEGEEQRPEALETLIRVVEAIGGRPVCVTAEEHDRAVARMSHLPQLLATALAAAVSKAAGGQAVGLAGNGFQDMTRLAASRWSVWEDICRANADEIITALDEVAGEVAALRAALASGDFSRLRQAFQAANEFMRYNS